MKKNEVDLFQTRCPYCREEFEPGTRAVVQCSGCSTHFHADCFDEYDICSVYGCKGILLHTPDLENFRPNLWPPIWIILYTVCIFAYLAAG